MQNVWKWSLTPGLPFLDLACVSLAVPPQGMVMVSPEMNPTICSVFEAEIVLLFHATTFRRGFQVTVHVGNVRQTAVVEKIHAKVRATQPCLHFLQGYRREPLAYTLHITLGLELPDPNKGNKAHTGRVAAHLGTYFRGGAKADRGWDERHWPGL